MSGTNGRSIFAGGQEEKDLKLSSMLGCVARDRSVTAPSRRVGLSREHFVEETPNDKLNKPHPLHTSDVIVAYQFRRPT
jgi:hypothetical protein